MDQQQRLCSEYSIPKDTDVKVFNYERASCDIGIVHLGLGAFHRAHQAIYTDDVLNCGEADWKILGVSLRSVGVRDQLNPQDGLYTLVEMSTQGLQYRLVGAIDQVLVAPENPQAVLDALVADSCKIISLTITEKGYCHDPAKGCLNKQHPDIVHDLSMPSSPKTAIGFIVEALLIRRQKALSIPTVLCCDNLPNNGATLKKIVVEFAQEKDVELAQWINTDVSFPNTMVDRIVPATQSSDIQDLQQACSYIDLGMVKTESFSQWVIEDNFTAGRPAWEKVGATLVDNVEPFELAKLRMLNGAHSSLAYLGYLAGYDYVHEVMNDSDFARFLHDLMFNEIAPTLVAPEGMDLTEYGHSLLKRFSNSALQHKTYQIAMDGSQKLPQRLLGTLRDQLAAGRSIEHLCLSIAGWMRYVMAFDEKGGDIVIQDPLAEQLKNVEQQSFDKQEKLIDIEKLVNGYLGISEVFGVDLPDNTYFKSRLSCWLGHILANGVSTTIKVFLAK